MRYDDRSYSVRLYERLGLDAELYTDEWVILTGGRMIAAVPYRDRESPDELERRILNVLSSRIK